MIHKNLCKSERANRSRSWSQNSFPSMPELVKESGRHYASGGQASWEVAWEHSLQKELDPEVPLKERKSPSPLDDIFSAIARAWNLLVSGGSVLRDGIVRGNRSRYEYERRSPPLAASSQTLKTITSRCHVITWSGPNSEKSSRETLQNER